MYHNYLDLAERLNATLPHEESRSAKIYVWTNSYDEKKHGVEVWINGVKTDVAVDCKRREMIPNIVKAYGIIAKSLSITITPHTIRLRSGKVIDINS